MIKNTLINMMRQLKFKNRKEIGIIMLIKRITKNNFKFMKESGKLEMEIIQINFCLLKDFKKKTGKIYFKRI